jgi:N-acetyl-anhydromuramyl-L-alanine amidase AmpD
MHSERKLPSEMKYEYACHFLLDQKKLLARIWHVVHEAWHMHISSITKRMKFNKMCEN